MKTNRHQEQIPFAVLEEAQLKANEIQSLLAPYLSALTPGERHDMAKMGRKTFSFVEKAYENAKQNPQFCPPYLNMDDFNSDFSDSHGLWTLLNTVQQLTDGLDDTQMSAGSEAFQAALIFYSSVHTAAAQDVSGAKAIYEDLRSRFPRGRHKSPEVDGDTPASEPGIEKA
jgi:hypothetical protein